MTKGRHLLKNINVLNAVLILAVLVMAHYAVAPSLGVSLDDIVPSQKKSAEEKELKPDMPTPPSPSDYLIIADENPFHPERKIPPMNLMKLAKVNAEPRTASPSQTNHILPANVGLLPDSTIPW